MTHLRCIHKLYHISDYLFLKLCLLCFSTQVHAIFYNSSRKLKIAAVVDGDTDVPTLTPVHVTNVKKSNKQKVVGVIGGCVAAVIVIIIGLLVYFCLMRLKRLIRRASDDESSAPSPSGKSNIRYYLLFDMGIY